MSTSKRITVAFITFLTLVVQAKAESEYRFSALKTDGTSVEGQLVKWDVQNLVVRTKAGVEPATLAWKDLVKVSRILESNEGLPYPTYPPRNRSVVIFPDGDRVACEIESSNDNEFKVQSLMIKDLVVPLTAPMAVSLVTFDQVKAGLDFMDLVQSKPESWNGNDSVLLTNGDIQKGGFVGIDAKTQKVKFRLGTNALDLERTGVKAIRFDQSLIQYPRPAGLFWEVTLDDGSRLGLTDLKSDNGANFSGKTRFGVAVSIATTDLARIHIANGSVVYLSDLEPAAVQYGEYLGSARPWKKNQNVFGMPLTLNNQTYDRGLGMQSRTLAVFRVGPKDRKFQALIGLDDQAGPQGNVIFRVLLDRTEKFQSKSMTFGESPQQVNVDLAGGKLLVLIVEYGSRGDVRDYANWVEARFIRDPQ